MFFYYQHNRRYIDLIFHVYSGVLSGMNASSLGLKPSSEGKRLYILLQYHANLAQVIKKKEFESHIFACI